MSKYYEAAKLAGANGKMEEGQGTIGAAYRYGRENPEKRRPGWTGAPSSFASEAWRAGRDAARENGWTVTGVKREGKTVLEATARPVVRR